MADDIDYASDLEMDFTRRAIEANSTGALKLKPIQTCYNCHEDVEGEKVFCGSECREDWELRRVRQGGYQRFQGAS